MFALEAVGGDPAVTTVVALADDQRDLEAVAATQVVDDAAGQMPGRAVHQPGPGVAGVDRSLVPGTCRVRVEQRHRVLRTCDHGPTF